MPTETRSRERRLRRATILLALGQDLTFPSATIAHCAVFVVPFDRCSSALPTTHDMTLLQPNPFDSTHMRACMFARRSRSRRLHAVNAKRTATRRTAATRNLSPTCLNPCSVHRHVQVYVLMYYKYSYRQVIINNTDNARTGGYLRERTW